MLEGLVDLTNGPEAMSHLCRQNINDKTLSNKLILKTSKLNIARRKRQILTTSRAGFLNLFYLGHGTILRNPWQEFTRKQMSGSETDGT